MDAKPNTSKDRELREAEEATTAAAAATADELAQAETWVYSDGVPPSSPTADESPPHVLPPPHEPTTPSPPFEHLQHRNHEEQLLRDESPPLQASDVADMTRAAGLSPQGLLTRLLRSGGAASVAVLGAGATTRGSSTSTTSPIPRGARPSTGAPNAPQLVVEVPLVHEEPQRAPPSHAPPPTPRAPTDRPTRGTPPALPSVREEGGSADGGGGGAGGESGEGPSGADAPVDRGSSTRASLWAGESRGGGSSSRGVDAKGHAERQQRGFNARHEGEEQGAGRGRAQTQTRTGDGDGGAGFFGSERRRLRDENRQLFTSLLSRKARAAADADAANADAVAALYAASVRPAPFPRPSHPTPGHSWAF